MSTDLMLPQGLAPSNLHLKPSVKARFVQYDVFDIVQRISREVDPHLHVWELSDEEDLQKQKWLVTELGHDGVERFVLKTDELDGRLIETLQRMIRIPFHVRVAALEAANEEWERQHHEEQLDRLYDKFGREMWYRLWKDGFIEQRGVSYPTRGITPTRS